MHRYLKFLLWIAGSLLACLFVNDFGGDLVRSHAGSFVALAFRGVLWVFWAWAALGLFKRGLMIGYGSKSELNPDGTMKSWSFWSKELQLSFDMETGSGTIGVEAGEFRRIGSPQSARKDGRVWRLHENCNVFDLEPYSQALTDGKAMYDIEHSQERRTATVFTSGGPVSVSGNVNVAKWTPIGVAHMENGLHALDLTFRESTHRPRFLGPNVGLKAYRDSTGNGFTITLHRVDAQFLALFYKEWNMIYSVVEARKAAFAAEATLAMNAKAAQ